VTAPPTASAAKQVTSYTWDCRNRLMTRTDPNGYLESYGSLTKPASCVSGLGNYDGMSDLLSWTDRNGKLTQYTWDDFGEPTKATYADGKSVSYTWTNGGTLQFTNENHGHTSTTYDSLYRLTGDYVYDPATDTYLGGGFAHYDNSDRLTTLNATNVTGGQPAINYTYDNANRMTAAGGYLGTVPIAYDAANRRIGIKLTNNIRGCYYYDTANELVNITYMPTGTSSCPTSAPTSGYLGNLTYTYDGAGRVASRGGSLFISVLPSQVSSATYDADNRLLTWNVPGGGTSFTYDHNGNMLTAGSTTYTWDDRNRLARVTGGASFSYDPLGRRIFTTLGGTTTSYTYFQWNPLMEQQGTTVTGEILAGLGLDERYQRTTTTGSSAGAYSMLTDALGSTVALTNSSGAITTTYAYDPYGNTTASGTASDSSYQFTGRENDGTGLYEYRNRYYAPSWGRFISEDPLGFGGRDADLYRYVGGNPVSNTDPLGLCGDSPNNVIHVCVLEPTTSPNECVYWCENAGINITIQRNLGRKCPSLIPQPGWTTDSNGQRLPGAPYTPVPSMPPLPMPPLPLPVPVPVPY
jgi:RHS repeat-associated protein